jgi:hypothetical protein
LSGRSKCQAEHDIYEYVRWPNKEIESIVGSFGINEFLGMVAFNCMGNAVEQRERERETEGAKEKRLNSDWVA